MVLALAASPAFATDGVCFAARNSGLYRSDDGGQTWRDAYAELAREEPWATPAVALSPDFAADRCVFAGAPGGVLRSLDGGQAWQMAALATPPPFVTALAVSPAFARDGMLFAATLEDGVFCSTDRGSRWAAWNFGLLDLAVLTLAISPAFAEDETLFAGTETGVFRSTNGGRAWREVAFPTELAPVLALAISPGFAEDGVLFAGTEEHGLWRSDDRGQTWAGVGKGMLGGATQAILLAPDFLQAPTVVVLAGDAICTSADGGNGWLGRPVGAGPDQTATTMVAPLGLDAEGPLLVGFADGQVRRA
jgi:photosystem II stability/assembly factor-like uncharacterized protein